jgi:hypothetical protein
MYLLITSIAIQLSIYVSSVMGLPNADEWPTESPIGRDAFEDCTQSMMTLERLVRFQDSCAFELLRVRIAVVD